MEELGAEPSSCPHQSTSFGTFSARICGRIPKQRRRDIDALKRRVDDSLASVSPTGPGWNIERKQHRRSFMIGAVGGNLTLHQKSGRVVFKYRLQFDSCLSTPVDTLPAGDEGGELPKRLKIVRVDYPEQARAARIDGIVALQVLIAANGRAGETCIQYVSRLGMGFEEAATVAVREWRWTPAKIHGVPVDFSAQIMVTFDLR